MRNEVHQRKCPAEVQVVCQVEVQVVYRVEVQVVYQEPGWLPRCAESQSEKSTQTSTSPIRNKAFMATEQHAFEACEVKCRLATKKLPKIIFIPRLVQRATTDGKELVPEDACLAGVSRQAARLSRLQMEAVHFPLRTSDIGRLD